MYVNLKKVILMLKSENDSQWNVHPWHNQPSLLSGDFRTVVRSNTISVQYLSLLMDNPRNWVWLSEKAEVFLSFSSLKCPNHLKNAQLLFQRVLETLFKRWSWPLASSMCSIKHKDNFIFMLLFSTIVLLPLWCFGPFLDHGLNFLPPSFSLPCYHTSDLLLLLYISNRVCYNVHAFFKAAVPVNSNTTFGAVQIN